ncbi:MAG: HDOD domain-containing protein [Gammaproteobacteria bacterium]|nr:HDOD domain-containing protein [Gammaproteobacteria bacterium]
MSQNAELNVDQPVMLDDLVDSGQELPSLPEILLRVSEQLGDENCSVEQIGVTIQHDPAITSRIMKAVNNSCEGLAKQISSVAEAVSLLGRERCRNILIGSVLREAFGDQENPAFSMQVFWQHSIKTALIARQLGAQIETISDPETMFTAGLLHDIGKLLLIDRFPQAMLDAEETMIRRRIDELSAELSQLGMTHTAVGEALMQHWGLPNILIDCARYHHEAVHDGPNRHATHLIYLANRLSEYVPPLDESETITILDDIENWNMAAVSIDQVASACQDADDQVFEVMESFGMVMLEGE